LLYIASNASPISIDKDVTKVAVHMKLLDYLRSGATEDNHGCPSSSRRFVQPITLVEQQSSDHDPHGQPWRYHINAFIQQQSGWQEQKLIHIVSAVCDDLEQRCENAEKPFREAEARVAELESAVADLRDRSSEFDQEVVDLKLRLQAAKAEKLEVQLTLQGENDRLIDRIHALEHTLKESNDAAKAQIERLASKHKSRELELRTTITEKEMLVDETTAQCEDMRQLSNFTKTALKRAQDQVTLREKEQEDSKKQLDFYFCELGEQRTTNQSLRDDIENLTRLQQITASSIDALQQELDQMRCEAKESASNYSAELARLESELQGTASHHETAVAELQRETEIELSAFRDREDSLSASLEAMKTEKDHLQRQQDQMNWGLRDQHKQIEQLQETIAAKDGEIAGFQTMRQTLAAAIGQLPERKHPRKSVHYAPSAHRSPGSHRQSKRLTDKFATSPSKNADSFAYGVTTQSHDVNDSFESTSTEGGSTSKRAKPLEPFKVAEVRQPRLNAVVTPKSVKLRSQRMPLTDIRATFGNISPSQRVMSMETFKVKCGYDAVNYDGVPEVEELEFGSEIFTNKLLTPGAPVPHGGCNDDETIDERAMT
jgi:myosin heavy subunit